MHPSTEPSTERPDDDTPASGQVVLVSAKGLDAASAPVKIISWADGDNITVTMDRQVTLSALGPMAAVELRGEHGERYMRKECVCYLWPGDVVVVHPGHRAGY